MSQQINSLVAHVGSIFMQLSSSERKDLTMGERANRVIMAQLIAIMLLFGGSGAVDAYGTKWEWHLPDSRDCNYVYKSLSSGSSGSGLLKYPMVPDACRDSSGGTVADPAPPYVPPVEVILAGTVVTYYHNDPLGSPIATTDGDGNVVWKEDYKPYGVRLRKEEAADANQQWFTGKPHEEEFGLSYFGARWYDPVTARFTGIDPVGIDPGNIHSFNRYAYANNNPYKYVDPDGRDAVGIVFDDYQVNTGYGFKLPLGHAGVLLIDNDSGLTKYYEFGRYSPNTAGIIGEKLAKEKGNIINRGVPNAVIGKDGKPTQESLNKIYSSLSKSAGKGHKVDATYHEGSDFKKMHSYINGLANDKGRDEYSILGNTCYSFMNETIKAGKAKKDE